jgi:putative membrane protein
MYKNFIRTGVPLVVLFLAGWSSGPAADADFMNTASQSNLAEIVAGRLASAKAGNKDIKAFADNMIADHTIAQRELVDLAQRSNVPLAQAPDTEHQNMAAQLEKMSGRAFDSAYINGQFLDHQVAVKLFRQESRVGKDTIARAYAAKYLPKLEHHLMMVKDLWKKVK